MLGNDKKFWCKSIFMFPQNNLKNSPQGSFCACTQPMRDGITLWCCLSLAGRMHRMIPVHWLSITTLEPLTTKSYDSVPYDPLHLYQKCISPIYLSQSPPFNYTWPQKVTMTLYGSAFPITGRLCGEFTSHLCTGYDYTAYMDYTDLTVR